jgi:ABC-2 type transport system permease protein/oleandomycin transport system permease protein
MSERGRRVGLERTVAPARIRFRFARDSALIAGRNLRVLRKNPGRLIYPLVQPLVILVMFVSVFGNLAMTGHPAAGVSYREFLIPGIMIENAALTAPTSGLALLRDASSGLADRFRSLPMSRSAVLIGRLITDAIVFTVQATLLLVAGYGFGFRIGRGLPLAVAAAIIAAVVAFGLAFAVLSAWLGLLIGDPETAERVLFFPAIAVAFVSSAFAPTGLLASWMQPIARGNPVSAACAVVRSLASGGSLGFPLVELGCWVLGLFLVPGVLAVRRWQAAW